jgi:hypothetical protein
VCIFASTSRTLNGPHWSEIAEAAYRPFETENLRHVFQSNVVNDGTVEHMETYRLNGLEVMA